MAYKGQKLQKDPIEIIETGSGCLTISNRNTDSNGYFSLRLEGKHQKYHRWIWEQHNRHLTKGEAIRHTCNNRSCVNIDHLELGVMAVNIEYKVNENGCHICTSHKKGRHGYPQGRDRINGTGTTENLHRIVWRRANGFVPGHLVVRHKCDNRMCVNVDHLELGTKKQNSDDMVLRGRSAKGSRTHNSKLTESDVKEIRKMLSDNMEYKDIAVKFNVWPTTIGYIKTGRTWKHVQ